MYNETVYNYQQPSPSGSGMIAQDIYVKIIEQPASRAQRFRYECEGHSAGLIPGISSKISKMKTFPTIKIFGYQGKAAVVVSCVTKDAPHRPHPHSLVGKEGCRKGVCTVEFPIETMSISFCFGIQCVKKKDMKTALKLREEVRVDPFKTGFFHVKTPFSVDFNAVKLCFQVYLQDKIGRYTIPLKPVVSNTIYDKKNAHELKIIKISDCVSFVNGGRQDIVAICEKVTKGNIKVRFFEEKDGELVWEDFGIFEPSQVYKQNGMWFKAPPYKSLDITEPVQVFFQLLRPSDGETSEPLPFQFLPLESEPGALKRKRQKFERDPAKSNEILRVLQEYEKNNLQRTYNINLNIPGVETNENEAKAYNNCYAGTGEGLSSMCIPSHGSLLQLNYRLPVDDPVRSTPSPLDLHISPNTPTAPNVLPTTSYQLPATSYQLPRTSYQLPRTRYLLPQNGNPSTSMNIQNDFGTISNNPMSMSIGNIPSGLSNLLLDLESQQLELKHLNSSELATLNNMIVDNLSENLSNSLHLNECNVPQKGRNT